MCRDSLVWFEHTLDFSLRLELRLLGSMSAYEMNGAANAAWSTFRRIP